jgi:hypothetical protein
MGKKKSTKSSADQPAGSPPPEAGKAAEAATPKKGKAKKEPKPKKVSCLDAAAQVLAAAGKPLGCIEMIEEMTKQGLWTSPNGQTPHATLYSAILRELNTKGKDARFVKSERGKFTRKG